MEIRQNMTTFINLSTESKVSFKDFKFFKTLKGITFFKETLKKKTFF